MITTIYPDQNKYSEDSNKYNMIPVCLEIQADMETPVSIFLKVGASMLLESIEKGENVGRFSIIGIGKSLEIRLNSTRITINRYNGKKEPKSESFNLNNPLEKVREYFKSFSVPTYEGLPPFFGGAIGYLGYETLRYFEDVRVIEGDKENGVPDGLLIVPETVLVYDSIKRTVHIITNTTPGNNCLDDYNEGVERIEHIRQAIFQPLHLTTPATGVISKGKPGTIRHEFEKSRFLEAVETCKEYIFSGDIIQVVISQQFFVETRVPPFELYRTLRVVNPSPYLFFLDFDDFLLVGSSPEVMVRLQDREILLKPIAGTRKRGRTITEDAGISRELLEDPKERAEHLMLVDLGRNDLGRVAVPGSVRVTDFMKVEKFSHVMHIVTTIKAELDERFDVFDVIRACFPAGTLTGAPKIRAMEIISGLEQVRRGPYGGMVFYLGFNGNMDSCITIRTILLKNGVACIQAGAGIVADSIPANEYMETVNKAGALIDTINITNENFI